MIRLVTVLPLDDLNERKENKDTDNIFFFFSHNGWDEVKNVLLSLKLGFLIF